MFWAQKKEKPFYKIFIEVTADKMGLDIPGVVQKTGLTDKQVRTIITRQMKVAPLDLAMQLSDTLNVPLEVWLGAMDYTPAEVTADAYEVARAYDRTITLHEIDGGLGHSICIPSAVVHRKKLQCKSTGVFSCRTVLQKSAPVICAWCIFPPGFSSAAAGTAQPPPQRFLPQCRSPSKQVLSPWAPLRAPFLPVP